MILLIFDTNEECDKFTYLYEKYHKTVVYTILRFIPDQYTAEDLLQEIYIIIGKNLHKIDLEDEQKSRNYIITITRNYTLSHLRKQTHVYEDFSDDVSTFKNGSEDILYDLIRRESFQELVNEINKLDQKYKMVLELKYINGFSDLEIADFLNIKVKTVQMRLYRSKNMLRKNWGANNDDRSFE